MWAVDDSECIEQLERDFEREARGEQPAPAGKEIAMKVVNVRTYGGVKAAEARGVVYVGRPSPLGNPYHIADPQALVKYRAWLWAKIKERDPEVLGALRQLTEDSVLGCWCKPAPCHADIVAKAWHWAHGQGILDGPVASPEGLDVAPLDARIMEHLNAHAGQHFTAAELASALHPGDQSVRVYGETRDALIRLWQEKWIRGNGRLATSEYWVE